jgi:hypothetical protein
MSAAHGAELTHPTHKRHSFGQFDGPESDIGSGMGQWSSMASLVGPTS